MTSWRLSQATARASGSQIAPPRRRLRTRTQSAVDSARPLRLEGQHQMLEHVACPLGIHRSAQLEHEQVRLDEAGCDPADVRYVAEIGGDDDAPMHAGFLQIAEDGERVIGTRTDDVV